MTGYDEDAIRKITTDETISRACDLFVKEEQLKREFAKKLLVIKQQIGAEMLSLPDVSSHDYYKIHDQIPSHLSTVDNVANCMELHELYRDGNVNDIDEKIEVLLSLPPHGIIDPSIQSILNSRHINIDDFKSLTVVQFRALILNKEFADRCNVFGMTVRGELIDKISRAGHCLNESDLSDFVKISECGGDPNIRLEQILCS